MSPVDVKQANKAELPLPERSYSETNAFENDKPIDKTTEEFHLKPSSRTTDEHARVNNTTSQGSDGINQAHTVTE
jgi:hypothetical protein